jgi:hypothetical protein
MVPLPRIELGTEHYHCSVLPLNYSGIVHKHDIKKSQKLQPFLLKTTNSLSACTPVIQAIPSPHNSHRESM